ncbi:MAG: XrtA/PEP-CTERM system TPR-repeat protein PrsT [Thiohalomonadales bacterium]
MTIISKLVQNLVLQLIMLALLSCGTNTSTPQEYLKNAVEYKQQNKIQAAIIDLKNALQGDPSLVAARKLLGQIYLEIGNNASAEKEFFKARKIAPNDEAVIIGLAKSLIFQNKYSDVFEQIQSDSTFSKDTQAELHIFLAKAKARLGKSNEANSDLVTAIKLAPGNDAVRLAQIEKQAATGDLNGALQQISKIIKEKPEFVRAWYIQGLMQFRQRSTVDSEKSFSQVLLLTNSEWMTTLRFNAYMSYLKALLIQDKLEQARVTVTEIKRQLKEYYFVSYVDGYLLFKDKKFEKARLRLQKVVNEVPEFMPAQLLMGANLFALENYEQADTYLNRFINRYPTHIQARKILAATRIRQNRPIEALQTLSPLIHDDTKDGQLLAMVAKATISSGAVNEGTQYLRDALKSSPKNSIIRAELANAYMQQGAIDQAISELQVLKGNDQLQRDMLLVIAHVKKRDFTTARKLAKKLIKNTPNPKTYTLAAGVELVDGQKFTTESYLQKALQLDSEFIPALSYSAQLALENDNIVEAESFYERILKQDRKNLSALLGKAIISGRRSDTDKALAYVQEAKRLNPTVLQPYLILSKYYINVGQFNKVLAIVNELQENAGKSPKSLLVVGRLQLMLRNYEDALATFNKLQLSIPNSPIAYIEIAKSYALLNKNKDAITSLKTALKIQPENISAKMVLTSLELRNKNFSEAIKLAKQLKKENKQYNVGYRAMGDIFMAQNKIKKAIAEYKDGGRRQQDKMIVMRLANAYKKEQNYKEVQKILETWIQRRPLDLDVSMLLAEAQQNNTDYEAAIKTLETMLTVRPKHVPSLNNLAWLYVQVNDSRALATAKSAYKLAPNRAEVADTYGWILLNQNSNETALALEILKKASDLLPNVAEAQYHLAAALHKTGDSNKAKSLLDQVIKSGSTFPEMDKAKALYREL